MKRSISFHYFFERTKGMARAESDTNSNTAAVQATNDDASASKLCVFKSSSPFCLLLPNLFFLASTTYIHGSDCGSDPLDISIILIKSWIEECPLVFFRRNDIFIWLRPSHNGFGGLETIQIFRSHEYWFLQSSFHWFNCLLGPASKRDTWKMTTFISLWENQWGGHL